MSSLSYSSLKEAYYNYDRKKPQNNQQSVETLIDYNNSDDCYYKKFGVNMESCKQSSVNTNNKSTTEFCDKFTNYNNNINQPSNCSQLQVPTYNYPVSDDAKKKFKEAIDLSLKENNQVSYDDFNKQSSIKNVQPYYDEDIDKYLNINNFKSILDNTAEKEKCPIQQSINPNSIDLQSPVTNTVASAASAASASATPNTTPLNSNDTSKPDQSINKKAIYNNYINIGLFIIIGIAIILLCNQITEIAINIGMKKTDRKSTR